MVALIAGVNMIIDQFVFLIITIWIKENDLNNFLVDLF